jgi:hypothetical protein
VANKNAPVGTQKRCLAIRTQQEKVRNWMNQWKLHSLRCVFLKKVFHKFPYFTYKQKSTKNEVERIDFTNTNSDEDDSEEQKSTTNVEKTVTTENKSKEIEDANLQNLSPVSLLMGTTERVHQNNESLSLAPKREIGKPPPNNTKSNQETTSNNFIASDGPANSILPESKVAPTVSVSAESETREGSTHVSGSNLAVEPTAPLTKKSTGPGSTTITGAANNTSGTTAMAEGSTNVAGTSKITAITTKNIAGSTKMVESVANVTLTSTMAEKTTYAGATTLSDPSSLVNGVATSLGSSFAGQSTSTTRIRNVTTASTMVYHSCCNVNILSRKLTKI